MSSKTTLDQYLSLEPIFDICIFGGQYSTFNIHIFTDIVYYMAERVGKSGYTLQLCTVHVKGTQFLQVVHANFVASGCKMSAHW
jgi:hypothetical protein